jgi:hypothetical protein
LVHAKFTAAQAAHSGSDNEGNILVTGVRVKF